MNIIILWPWQLRLVATVTSVLYAHPAPEYLQPWERAKSKSTFSFAFKKILSLFYSPEKTLSFHFKCLLWRIPFNISKIQSWTKMLRKMHVICLILEYFPLKPGSLKILPPPKKNNVEVWPEHFCCLLNNIDQGEVGRGVTMVPNTQGGSPVCKKEQNS